MNIGFIGLGIMGKPMCKNLLKAGHRCTVYDIMETAMDEVAAAGAKRAGVRLRLPEGKNWLLPCCPILPMSGRW